MKCYQVICSRDEAGYWNASVPDVPGAHTFARRLDQIPGRIKEALRLFPESVPPEFDVELEPRLPAQMEELVRQTNELREQARRTAEQANEQTRAAAAALKKSGLPMRDVGELLHVSHQRVGQLLEAKQ
jgi:predicted RNase H-like HicB family nuclease